MSYTPAELDAIDRANERRRDMAEFLHHHPEYRMDQTLAPFAGRNPTKIEPSLSGKELFDKYVGIGLCCDPVYEWEKLSPALQGRWDRLAFDVRVALLKD